jgi:hypothetical protein
LELIQNSYPDLRRIINDIQRFSLNGVLSIKNENFVKKISKEVFDMLLSKQNCLKIRKFVIEDEKKFSSNYQSLMTQLFDYFYEYDLSDIKKKNILLELGEYLYRDSSVVDKEINFFCCLISLEKTLSS